MTTLSAPRYPFVDLAKGISITLVVIWHAIGPSLFWNEALIFIRMPLFFFVAGLFAAKSMTMEMPSFLKEKISYLLYLFVLWSCIYFASVTLIGQVLDKSFDFSPLLTMLWDPPLTMWFIYALAISYLIAKLLRFAPALLVLAVSIGIYIWSVATEEWSDHPFPDKLMRLFPFFFIAMTYSKQILGFVPKIAKYGPLGFVAFMAIAIFVYDSIYAGWGVVTFLLSVLGIASVLSICALLQDTKIGRVIAWVGQGSLFVYVMHRIVLAYSFFVLKALGIEGHVVINIALSFIVIAITVFLGKYILQPRLPLLFNPPWLEKRNKVVSPEIPKLA